MDTMKRARRTLNFDDGDDYSTQDILEIIGNQNGPFNIGFEGIPVEIIDQVVVALRNTPGEIIDITLTDYPIPEELATLKFSSLSTCYPAQKEFPTIRKILTENKNIICYFLELHDDIAHIPLNTWLVLPSHITMFYITGSGLPIVGLQKVLEGLVNLTTLDISHAILGDEVIDLETNTGLQSLTVSLKQTSPFVIKNAHTITKTVITFNSTCAQTFLNFIEFIKQSTALNEVSFHLKKFPHDLFSHLLYALNYRKTIRSLNMLFDEWGPFKEDYKNFILSSRTVTSIGFTLDKKITKHLDNNKIRAQRLTDICKSVNLFSDVSPGLCHEPSQIKP